MKSSFVGYYSPTPEEFRQLWSEALIILDTNILLDCYRLPQKSREEFLDILEGLKDRIWIPHQVALEFQKNRLTVIASEKKNTDAALANASSLIEGLKQKIDILQMDKRGLGVEFGKLLENLENANRGIVEAISLAHKSQLDISSSDPIRDRLDGIIGDHVGIGPGSQAQLDALVVDGEARFSERIPPGFSDSEKAKNPIEATFLHDHLKYERRFGDLIVWKQILEYTKSAEITKIIFVTADNKEDWWWRAQGKTIGPHPELVREAHRLGGIELFWMYSSDQFLENAATHLAAPISSESLTDLQNVRLNISDSAAFIDYKSYIDSIINDTKNYNEELKIIRRQRREWTKDLAISAVSRWLQRNEGAIVEVNARGFPDIVALCDGDLRGYEVIQIRSIVTFALPPSAVNAALRGYIEVNEGRLSSFTLAIIADEDELINLSDSQYAVMKRRAKSFLERYPIGEIIVGTILDSSEFAPLALYSKDDSN